MHECIVCGQQCDCDMEDLDQPAPDDCDCDHSGSGLDSDGVPYLEYDDEGDPDCCPHGVPFDEECEACEIEDAEDDHA